MHSLRQTSQLSLADLNARTARASACSWALILGFVSRVRAFSSHQKQETQTGVLQTGCDVKPRHTMPPIAGTSLPCSTLVRAPVIGSRGSLPGERVVGPRRQPGKEQTPKFQARFLQRAYRLGIIGKSKNRKLDRRKSGAILQQVLTYATVWRSL